MEVQIEPFFQMFHPNQQKLIMIYINRKAEKEEIFFLEKLRVFLLHSSLFIFIHQGIILIELIKILITLIFLLLIIKELLKSFKLNSILLFSLS